jgi:hypothetical protein
MTKQVSRLGNIRLIINYKLIKKIKKKSELAHSAETQKCVTKLILLDKEFSEFIKIHQEKCAAAFKVKSYR